MTHSEIVLSSSTKNSIENIFTTYWVSPFCSGMIELGETLLAWALGATPTNTKMYADAIQYDTHVAYQIKTGLPASPVTFARLTTSSQRELVNSNSHIDTQTLGNELLSWVQERITQPLNQIEAIQEVRVARIIYTKRGDFTFYERAIQPELYDLTHFRWQWSPKGNALEGFRNDQKWFSWYPQGRINTRNQNQLHFHGENHLIPDVSAPNRFDFSAGEPAQIPFEIFIQTLRPLVQQFTSRT